MYTLEQIMEFVIHSFLDEKTLMLPVLFEKYKQLTKKSELFKFNISDADFSRLCHSAKWLLRMMKIRLGKSLLIFGSMRKQVGRMLYRNGTDLLSALHSLTA